MEPKHPTYGTLDQLLAEIKRETMGGQLLRIGHQGALNWFAHEYGLQSDRGANPNG